ncbi:MAG: HEPN domain-containing protein [Bdellovibrionota bacterium]
MTPEQSAFLQKAEDNLQAAKLLIQGEHYDVAVSRAYYTMFYLAKAFLGNRGLGLSKHSAVIAAFGKEFVSTGMVDVEFHAFLIGAQEHRIMSDYDYGPSHTREEAAKYTAQAEKFLAMAKERF